MSVLKSKYVPGICCNHRWVPTHLTTVGCSHECDKCGAVCERGSDGQISYYSTLAGMNIGVPRESTYDNRRRLYGSFQHDSGVSRSR